MDVETFCRRCVDPMEEEADQVQIIALTETLQVPLRVVYLSPSPFAEAGGAGGSDVDAHPFQPDRHLEGVSTVHLLYRPGHYDLLYPCA